MPLVPQNPLADFDATFWEPIAWPELTKFEENVPCGHNLDKLGQFCVFWGLLTNSAAILWRPVPRSFFSRESPLLAPKISKNMFLGLAGNSQRSNPCLVGQDGVCKRLQPISDVLQAVLPKTATSLLVSVA